MRPTHKRLTSSQITRAYACTRRMAVELSESDWVAMEDRMSCSFVTSLPKWNWYECKISTKKAITYFTSRSRQTSCFERHCLLRLTILFGLLTPWSSLLNRDQGSSTRVPTNTRKMFMGRLANAMRMSEQACCSAGAMIIARIVSSILCRAKAKQR